MSRIVGQCNIADFKSIEHLAVTLENPEMFDPSTLTRKQKLAMVIIAAFKEAGIKHQELYRIREILFWDNGRVEFKFLNVPGVNELQVKLRDTKVRADMARGIQNMLGSEGR